MGGGNVEKEENYSPNSLYRVMESEGCKRKVAQAKG